MRSTVLERSVIDYNFDFDGPARDCCSHR